MDSTMISAIFSTMISGIVSFLVCKWQLGKQRIQSEESRLNEHLFGILNCQMEYPYLENKLFCNTWKREKVNDTEEEIRNKYQRYDTYCCMVFNFLSQIFDLYNGDKDKIENFFAVEEMVKRHKLWWSSPINHRDNIDGYSVEFREFIKTY